MQEFDIEKFDPTAAALNELVAKSQAVVVTDVTDKTQIELVHANRMTLKKARVSITAKGKELREEAVSFQKKVIAKEKELIAIIEPEEDRLELIEKQAEEAAEMKKRAAKLPARHARLDAIGDVDTVGVTDENLIGMDDMEFENYFNARVNDHARAQAAARQREQDERQRVLDEKEAALNAEQRRIDQEKQDKENAERAEIEAKRREEEHAAEVKEAEERAAQKERARIEQEARDKKARDAAEFAALEKDRKYKAFLKENGWTKETANEFSVIHSGNKAILYKKVAEFTAE